MTADTLRAQYARNAASFATLALKALRSRTGRAHGQPAAYWADKAQTYRDVSELDDAGLAAHLRAAQASVTDRLAAIKAGR